MFYYQSFEICSTVFVCVCLCCLGMTSKLHDCKKAICLKQKPYFGAMYFELYLFSGQ